MNNTPMTDEIKRKYLNTHECDFISEIFESHENIEQKLAEVIKQREALVEAIEFVLEDSEIPCGHFWPDVLKKCREALLKVKGGER